MEPSLPALPVARRAKVLSPDETRRLADLVAGAVPEFLTSNGFAETTRETYQNGLRRFGEWLRETDAAISRQTVVEGYRDFLVSAGFSAYTVPTYIASVAAFFKWCRETYENVPPIKVKVKCRKPKDHARSALTLTEAQRLLDAVPTDTLSGKRDKAILGLLLSTGLRRSEALNALVGDLRMEGGKHVLRFKGKGRAGKDQVKVLPPGTYAVVEDYLLERERVSALAPDEPLFVSLSNNNRCGKMSAMGLSRIVKRYLKKVGLEGRAYTCHSLRHTAITLCCEGTGGNVLKMQSLAGHSNINTTMIYVHEFNRLQDPPEAVVSRMLFEN